MEGDGAKVPDMLSVLTAFVFAEDKEKALIRNAENVT